MKAGVTNDLGAIRAAIETFLAGAREPAILEPGEELLPLIGGNYALEMRGSRLTLQAWDRTRNWSRRLTAITEASNARLSLTVERFARREGRMFLLDLGRRSGAELGKRTGRLVFRERFRLFLRRQFPEWTLAEVSAEADLEHSLSPAFPRAYLKHGQHGWAAIACPSDGDAAAVLSFGLIWLAYLRGRERRVALEGLAIYLPAGTERAAALRVLCLDPNAARFELFTYTPEDVLLRADPHDYGNLDTRLEMCCRPAPNLAENGEAPWQQIAYLPGVERVPKHDGRVSLRVRGIEFAELSGRDLLFGLSHRRPAREHHAPEIARLAEELDRVRSAGADTGHELYRQYPEAWLESQARAEIETLDATLRTLPVYGQVPAFAGGDRGVLDLLAVDHTGRLTVVELKASADLHLPLQALDYWVRVKWHLDRGEFSTHGYFPGIELRNEAPRLLLVSPALEFHPTTETLLSFFAPGIEVERVGLAVEWRRELHVMFRLYRRAAAPVNPMLKVMKQAKAAFSLLSADEINKQAETPLHIGLVADGSSAYAEMEEFLVPSTLPRAEWRQRITQVHRASDANVPANVDIVLYEPGLPCPAGSYTFRRDNPEATCLEILGDHGDLDLALGRQFRPFRKPVVERIIHMVAKENALFAIATALPNVVPSLIELPWIFGEFASDTAFLTANQVRMAFQIAAACGKDVGLAKQKGAVLTIAAGAFGWRALAREMVSHIPLGGGLIPKGAIAYAGTYLAGKGLEYVHVHNGEPSAAQREQLYQEGLEHGRSFSRTLHPGESPA